MEAYLRAAEGRSLGMKCSERTRQSYQSALRIFLPALTREVIAAFPEEVGAKETGIVDRLLDTGRMRPRSVQTYLSAVKKFAHWLSAQQAFILRLKTDYASVKQMHNSVEFTIRSLDHDVNRDRIAAWHRQLSLCSWSPIWW